MGWYDDLPSRDQSLARLSPAGLAVVHTQFFAPDSGRRWKLYPYCRLIAERFTPMLLNGGKGMLFMPPRHGKSLFSSIYTAAWFVMVHGTKNVILTGYSADLAQGFSDKAKSVVQDMGHIFGVRVNPKQANKQHWQVQVLNEFGEWQNGGEVYAAGADGPLPGRGGHLIVMDDVVKGGNKDTSPQMMEKCYNWYRSVLETRLEPLGGGKPGAMLLVMTRWAQADIAGRLLEDEPDDWDVLRLPALAKEDDPLGRDPGEALCPERYDETWLNKKRDSSEEGGIIFEALYQQDPIPDGGLLFRREDILKWEEFDGVIFCGDKRVPRESLDLWFATIDPGLKEKELNDPTGFLVWAITPSGELLQMEDHTKRMRGSDDLIPVMTRVREEHPGIHFFMEDQAHGTEIIRACRRKNFDVRELKADRDKVTRWIGAQPAFAAHKVFLAVDSGLETQKEMLGNPGGRHDDRLDCVAYAVQVWRERIRLLVSLDWARKPKEKEAPAEIANVHPDQRPQRDRATRDRYQRYTP